MPSTRCMMVHSKAFGRYHGDEEVVHETPLFSELNLLSHYAPTQVARVKVFDALNKPVEGASVRFKLYNYSEFYTLADIKTDANGEARLTTGLGDLMIWATDGENYNYAKMDVRQNPNMEIYLTRQGNDDPTEYSEQFDMVPPAAGVAKVTPSKEKADCNAKRLEYEDSLRTRYMATFPTRDNFKQIVGLPENNKASLSDEQVWEIVHRSEGNYGEIGKFIAKHYCDDEANSNIYDYLKSYSDKDMRDISCEVLEHHLTHYDVESGLSYEDYAKGLMPARISNELVRPWRTFLCDALSAEKVHTPNELRAWVSENVHVDQQGNYYNCPISPRGVFELRHSDAHSRDIFFVAACRALFIPAYLDNATNTIYAWDYDEWGWVAVSLTDADEAQPSARLTLTYTPTKELATPVYWSHFTIAKFDNGDFHTFDFEEDSRMQHFPASIDLEPGYYRLMTGNRYPEGDVLTSAEYFKVGEGDKVVKEIVLRPLSGRDAKSVAAIDPTMDLFADMATVADYAGSKGALFVFLGDYKEPSKHLVKEMQALKKEYEQWGGMTYMVAPAQAKASSFGLPNTDCAMRPADKPDAIETAILDALRIDLRGDYPLVALVNSKGEILFHSHGYSIGLAEQILKHANKE